MSITSPSEPERHPSGTGPISESTKRVGRGVEDRCWGMEGKECCASSFGLHWLKVHEPRPERSPALAAPEPVRSLPILLDLVVECAEDADDGARCSVRGGSGNLKLCSDLYVHGLRDGLERQRLGSVEPQSSVLPRRCDLKYIVTNRQWSWSL